LKLASSPTKPQAGQRTEAKCLPHWGHFFSLPGTSAPQISQKKRGLWEPPFEERRILNQAFTLAVDGFGAGLSPGAARTGFGSGCVGFRRFGTLSCFSARLDSAPAFVGNIKTAALKNYAGSPVNKAAQLFAAFRADL
jgi:hypothetical protein